MLNIFSPTPQLSFNAVCRGMASKLAMVICAALFEIGSAVIVHSGHPSGLTLHGKTMGAIPMEMFTADCSLAVANRNPGAGMDPGSITPFQTVLKDGFYNVDCVDDYMWQHGDKFGNNKNSYELGEVANVSIVHYGQLVPKEDAETMTPEVCFSFCRTIPDMSFFGIRNGNKCYCTPYFQSVAGDDSMCDVVCEGDATMMCGSTTKSSVFGMHSCANSTNSTR